MYCNFNHELFKQFTSQKVKIKPALSDDWEMIPRQYRSLGGFSLRSKKLNQEVADINLMRFLKFSKEQNLTIQGLKLKGTYIVGSDRSVYTEEMYQEYIDKFSKRTENIINKKDYKVGNKYLTPCGAEVIYLGSRYVSRMKTRGIFNIDDCTKMTLKHYVINSDFNEKDVELSPSWKIQELKMKFSKDYGTALAKEKADEYLNYLYEYDLKLVYFNKEKIKDFNLELLEVQNPKRSLIANQNNSWYCSKYDYIGLYGDFKIKRYSLKEINPETFEKGCNAMKDMDFSENSTFYRLGLVEK